MDRESGPRTVGIVRFGVIWSHFGVSGAILVPKSDLNLGQSKIVKKLDDIKEYAIANKMKLNIKKTKLMVFNPSKTIDFEPNINLHDIQIETYQ